MNAIASFLSGVGCYTKPLRLRRNPQPMTDVMAHRRVESRNVGTKLHPFQSDGLKSDK